MNTRSLKTSILLSVIFLWPGYLWSLPVFNSITVNSDEIDLYTKIEITVDMSANFINPFDYNQVWLRCYFTSPSNEVSMVDGFYYQGYDLNPPSGDLIPDGDPVWKIRFSPSETGTWTYEIRCSDNTGTTFSSTYTFACLSSADPGFVRTTSSKFLKFDDDTTFFPIGENLAWSYGDDGFYEYNHWMDSLSANGANFIKLIMTPWSFGIEWSNTGLGNYTNRLDIAFWLDWVMEKATSQGSYIELCPLMHDEVSTLASNQWQYSPYNAANGGPCQNTWDFYTNATAKDYYKRKLRYINARWGYSTHIMAWELACEIDNTGDFNDHRDEINDWLVETGQYLNSIDINDHLISLGYAFFEHDAEIWNNPLIDLTQIHVYHNSNDLELKLYAGTRDYLLQYDKPNNIGEFALTTDPITCILLDPDGIAFYNSLWASSLSGAFGAAATWWWDNYIETQNLYYHFKPVTSFMHSIDLQQEEYAPVSVMCEADDYLDVVIEPGYQTLFQPAPENYFTVERTGNIIPRANNLSILLYGYMFNSSRNPPHFAVDYAEAGQFSVVTGGNAFLSRIKIWIDGVNVLNLVGHANTTYTTDVEAGTHTIFVENTGNGYIEVDKYIFANYAPLLRSFALKSQNHIVGWLQNRNYNWEYVNNYGDPAPLSGGMMNFSGLNEGYYQTEWWNCSSLETDSISLYASSGGDLAVAAPAVVWDAAYKMDYISPVMTPAFTATPTHTCTGDTVVFTDNSTGIIKSRLWSFPGGTPSSSTLEEPQIVYTHSGNFNATLTLYNDFDTAVLTKSNYILIDTLPAAPGFISGPTSVCMYTTNVVYSVAPIPHATSYAWTLPPGASGYSTTRTIHVSFGTAALSGNISVKGVNFCGYGPVSSKYITVIPLVGSAGPIAGDTTVCHGQANRVYSIDPIANATSYIWTLPPGATGTSTGTNISVAFPSASTSGNISVKGANSCGTGSPTFKFIHVNPFPSAAGPIYGDILVCQNEEDLYYHIDEVSHATSYEWILPSGVEGQSNTNEIYLTFTVPSVCNLIEVKGVNDCGEGDPAFLGVCTLPLPIIGEQPHDTTIYIGDDAVFETTYTMNLAYHWQKSQNNGLTWSDLSDDGMYDGSNTSVLGVSGVVPAMNGYKYHCVVSGSCGPPVTSDPATLHVVPQGWLYSPTEAYHKFKIPLLAHPVINGDPIDVDDYVGVFFENDSGEWQCGGLEQWNGVITTTVFAYGDDPQTPEKDGFYAGESIHWEIYSQEHHKSYDATPTYLFGPSTFTVNAVTTLQKLEAFDVIQQTVALPEGWSGLSSYIIPADDSVTTIFDSITDDLVILMNASQVYWPEENINTIVTWNTYSGYKIKVTDATQVVFSGTLANETNLLLKKGWDLMPVISENDVSTLQTDIFNDLGDTLVIAKEIAGSGVYWPGQEIFTLEWLIPGKAYMVDVTKDCHIHFPPTGRMIKPVIPDHGYDVTTPWNPVTATPNSHIVAINKTALTWVSPGDILGVFTPGGLCAGMVRIEETRVNVPLTIYGDDPTTPDVTDGFAANEPMSFKIFRPGKDTIYCVEATFNKRLPDSGLFVTNGLSEINSFQLLLNQPELALTKEIIRVYPNPVTHEMDMDIAASADESMLYLFNCEGQLIRYMPVHSGHSVIDMAFLANGTYILKVITKQQVWYKKIIKK
jgi:PKD repeat protein